MWNGTWFAVVLVLSAACGSNKDADQTGGSATVAGSGAGGSGSGTAAAAAAGSGTGTGSGTGSQIDTAAICADSGLLLKDFALDQAGARFCDLCKATIANACNGTWPDDFVAKGVPAGERMDLLRNTIYAGYGYPFKKQKWIDLFSTKAWYRKNAAFAEANLSKVARANVARLKETRKNAGTALSLVIHDKQLTGEYDVDGDGTADPIAIAADGSKVTVDGVDIAVDAEDPDGGGPWFYGVAVIDVDGKATGAEIALHFSQEEDLESWQVYEVAGGKATALGTVPPGDVAGNGTVVSRGGNCGVTTWTTWKLVKGKGFEQASEKKSGTYDEDLCAACPYVYLHTEDGAVFQGEVLRYQAGAAAYRADVLAVADRPALAGGMIRIELREEKPETTYLDAIQLEVDGELVDPSDCNDAGGTPCAADRRFTVIRTGEARAFAFPWRGAPPRAITVRATGYYVPDGR
jgi:hypothetical protein